jgi:hypothetical protein
MLDRTKPFETEFARVRRSALREFALRAVFIDGASYLKAAKRSGLSIADVAIDAGEFAGFLDAACATFDGVAPYNHEVTAQVTAAREAMPRLDPNGRLIRIYCLRRG